MRGVKKTDLQMFAAIALLSAVICITSFISIPFPIPITLQTFGVYFALFMLGGKRGMLSVLLYVCIGAVGLPVFSGFTGGVSRLFDATGGYIFGFIVLSFVFWFFSTSLPKWRISCAISSAVSLIALYLTGSLWYAFVYLDGAKSFVYALAVSVLPFILPDVLKIILAYFTAKRISAIIKIRY